MANEAINFDNDPINIIGTVSPTKKARVKNTSIATKRTPGLTPIEEAIAPKRVGPNNDGILEAGLDTEVNAISKATIEQTDVIKDIDVQKRKNKSYLAAANFALTTMNAVSAYGAVSSNAQLRILEARRSAADSLERGKQRALEAQAEGQFAAEDSLLSLAAQGQDVTGAAVQKVQGSLEDIGMINALREETDSIREALGFDLEEVAINYQVDQAEIQRNATILSAGLNFGANVASL